jgi:hypothetical protein
MSRRSVILPNTPPTMAATGEDLLVLAIIETLGVEVAVPVVDVLEASV